MSETKRVYLAKDYLASGLDVQFVKSNLLRIPGIEVIEYGSGIDAKNCDAVVIVSNVEELFETSNDEFTVRVPIGKSISDIIDLDDDFFPNTYIYVTKEETCSSTNVEDYDLYVSLVDGKKLYKPEKSTTEKFAKLYCNNEYIDLLDELSHDYSYYNVPAKHLPEEKYRVPEILPKHIAQHSMKNDVGKNYGQSVVQKVNNSLLLNDELLLLLRKK